MGASLKMDFYNDKTRLYNKLYNFVKHVKKIFIWKIWIILILVAIIFDIFIKHYMHLFFYYIFDYRLYTYLTQYMHLFCNQIINYNNGNLINIVVVIWTFTVTVGMFCLSKKEEKFYNIKVWDIFLQTFTIKGACFLVAFIAGEIAILIVIAIMDWTITLIVIALLQFYITCLLVLVVGIYLSKRSVIILAEDEIDLFWKNYCYDELRKNEFPIFKNIIKNTDYESESEQCILSDLLKRTSKGYYTNKSTVKTQAARDLYAFIIEMMFLNNNIDTIYPVIKQWYFYKEENYDINTVRII